MKLKYYLRGLGIGIAVTAVILSVSTKGETLTDAQIVAKAKELGMVEETVLSELESEEETAETQDELPEEQADAGTQQQKAGDSMQTAEAVNAENKNAVSTAADVRNTGDAESTAEEVQNIDNADAKPENDTKDSDQEEAVEGEAAAGAMEENVKAEMESSVIVSVYPGEGSYTVSRKLAALGLVESADVYDKFLCQNGYDKKLCTGNYEIKAGASADEIAGILTKRK